MLQRLPEELLDHILSFLSWSLHSQDRGNQEDTQALIALSRVNKTLCRLARPLLYRVCDMSAERSQYGYDTQDLDSLLATLAVLRPANASLVKELRVRRQRYDPRAEGLRDESAKVGLGRPAEFNRRLAAIYAAIDTSLPHRLEIAQGLARDEERAKIALVLALCWNLEVLVLDLQVWERSNLIPRLLGWLAHHRDLKIADFTLVGNGTAEDFEWEGSELESLDGGEETATGTAVSYKRPLPSSETFRGFGIIGVEHLESFDFTSVQAPVLRKLTLRDSMLDEAAILEILSHFPLLEHLSIHWGGTPALDQFGTDYQLMGDHLRRHGLRLRTLELDLRQAMFNEFHDFTEPGSCLGSLEGLVQLETLRIPLQLLIGEPDCLQDPIDVALERFLGPSLQSLELLTWPDDVPVCQGLRRIMDSTKLQRLSRIVARTNGRYRDEESAVGWRFSWEGGWSTLQREHAVC